MRKLTLLALAVGALVAFAVPAVAQAEDEWWTHIRDAETTEIIGEETVTHDEKVEFTGELSSTKAPVRNGPCEVHATVTLGYDAEETATAEVEDFEITTPGAGCQVFINVGGGVYAPVTGCFINEATTAGLPWHVDIDTTKDTNVDITNASFTNEYVGCGALGIPNGGKLTAEGTATGDWNGTCIEFNNDGDMLSNGAAVTIDGEVCSENVTLKEKD